MDVAVMRSGLIRAVVLGALLLTGCATPRPAHIDPPPLRGDFPQLQVVDVDVLAVSPEMEKFLQEHVLVHPGTQTRMTVLMDAVSADGVLGFRYDEVHTLTSVQAFNTRAGNCIGFANMLVALARRAGIKARYQEVLRRPQWSSREETVLLVKHINVILEAAGSVYVMDVSGIRISPNSRRRAISDDYAKALYFNNLGAEALIRGDLPTAHAFMSKAIETEPMLTDSWVNIGVVLGRNDQLEDAATVLRMALEINSNEYAALSNLYEIYISQENFEAAAVMESRVERYRQRNPYYLMQLSEEALLLGDEAEALALMQSAISKKNNDHQLYFALARAQFLNGAVEDAGDSIERAQIFAPPDMVAYYNRPLDELVAESMAAARAKALAEAEDKTGKQPE